MLLKIGLVILNNARSLEILVFFLVVFFFFKQIYIFKAVRPSPELNSTVHNLKFISGEAFFKSLSHFSCN